MVDPRYLPISAYGAIGDMRTVALVGNNGSIDWCCLPEIDDPSVFAALLDDRKGGRFRIGLPDGRAGEQEYIKDSNVLRTRFRTAQGEVTLTDLMRLPNDLARGTKPRDRSEIIRILECTNGRMELGVEWSPRFDYARDIPLLISEEEGGWFAKGKRDSMFLGGLRLGEAKADGLSSSLRGRIKMRSGEVRAVISRWGSGPSDHDQRSMTDILDQTVEAWRKWVHGSEPVHQPDWAQEHYPLLIRSELVLKMLTNIDTGAIVAAPTTSLPEAIGGSRNYDYRYAWVRDASLAAQALTTLGHENEAIELLFWIEEVSAEHFEDGRPQIMYGVHGESDLQEIDLPHLEGYRGSRPVRIGNEAAKQIQLEVPGEVLNTAYELARRGYRLNDRTLQFISRIMDLTSRVWREPDHGIWEIRGERKHFTYSKVMLWAAFDRALQLDKMQHLEGDKEGWRRTKDSIRREVLLKGYDEEVGAFVQSYGSKRLDAANLRIPLQEFLPFDDPRVQGTIDRSMEQLMENGLVHRYQEDDLQHWGEEGSFGICTCWLVDALALSGRAMEAREVFEGFVRRANPLALMPEQIDTADGTFLGNYPQAFSHIGLINSVLYLAYAEGRLSTDHHLIGTREHRMTVQRHGVVER